MLALKKHPDKQRDNPNAAAEFNLIQRAYELLSDAQARAALDDLHRHAFPCFCQSATPGCQCAAIRTAVGAKHKQLCKATFRVASVPGMCRLHHKASLCLPAGLKQHGRPARQGRATSAARCSRTWQRGKRPGRQSGLLSSRLPVASRWAARSAGAGKACLCEVAMHPAPRAQHAAGATPQCRPRGGPAPEAGGIWHPV